MGGGPRPRCSRWRRGAFCRGGRCCCRCVQERLTEVQSHSRCSEVPPEPGSCRPSSRVQPRLAETRSSADHQLVAVQLRGSENESAPDRPPLVSGSSMLEVQAREPEAVVQTPRVWQEVALASVQAVVAWVLSLAAASEPRQARVEAQEGVPASVAEDQVVKTRAPGSHPHPYHRRRRTRAAPKREDMPQTWVSVAAARTARARCSAGSPQPRRWVPAGASRRPSSCVAHAGAWTPLPCASWPEAPDAAAAPCRAGRQTGAHW